ncbi:hypothetical protein [Pseudoalteromonas piscicida]|uniref:hypothetical protein n=1 Tax=Pseudoalteromonas piscicida TaxID=43662 RepID=UPI001D0A1487|nr:hypothetical protein [Pseudoalteromonas piscicida]
MNISLRTIDKQNYEAICDLDVSPEQQDLVACNMFSIVESKFNHPHTYFTTFLQYTFDKVRMLFIVSTSLINLISLNGNHIRDQNNRNKTIYV